MVHHKYKYKSHRSASNTMLPRPRPTIVPSGILIHPAVWPQQTWAKNGGVPLFGGGEAGSPSSTMWPGPRPTAIPSGASWSMQPFGHNRHGPKIEGFVPFLGSGELGLHLAQYGLDRGLPSYQVAFWSMQPFGHNRHGPAPLFFFGGGEGELGPHLTQCDLGRGLRTCQVSS